MGGGAHYPYPKEVWSPSGGWWSRPSNWKANTFICVAGITGLTFAVWKYSAQKEIRTQVPNKPIPSQKWSPQAASLGYKNV